MAEQISGNLHVLVLKEEGNVFFLFMDGMICFQGHARSWMLLLTVGCLRLLHRKSLSDIIGLCLNSAALSESKPCVCVCVCVCRAARCIHTFVSASARSEGLAINTVPGNYMKSEDCSLSRSL